MLINIEGSKQYETGRLIIEVMETQALRTIKEACDILDINPDSGRRCVHYYRKGQDTPVSYPERVYKGEAPAMVIPTYTGHEVIKGDCIVTGDYQLPTTDWQIAEWVFQVGIKTGIKQLVICGDWINCDAFSVFTPSVPEISFFDECRASRDLISRYAKHFDLILLTMGNHEKRYLKSKRGMMSMQELMGHISFEEEAFRISPYPYVTIESGGERWHVTHPRNYNRITGRLGDELAQKHHSNVILLHQHHVGKIMDTWGRYVIIDGGGIFDQKKMAYVAMEDTRMPVMANGFTVIQNGTAELITPYPAYTDLKRWGLKQGKINELTLEDPKRKAA